MYTFTSQYNPDPCNTDSRGLEISAVTLPELAVALKNAIEFWYLQIGDEKFLSPTFLAEGDIFFTRRLTSDEDSIFASEVCKFDMGGMYDKRLASMSYC